MVTLTAIMLYVIYAKCHCMLRVAKKPIMLSVVMLNVVAPLASTTLCLKNYHIQPKLFQNFGYQDHFHVRLICIETFATEVQNNVI
jgi:hypothetical protein